VKKARQRHGTRKTQALAVTSAGKKARYVWLNVLPDDLWLKVRRGVTIWEALKDTDVEVEGRCGGLGKCGKCKVKVISAIGPPTEEERELLDEEELQQGIRLACRTVVDKDLTLYAGGKKPDPEYFQILKSGHQPVYHFEPHVEKRVLQLVPDTLEDGLSDFGRIKVALGAEHHDLTAGLQCLKALPRSLKRAGDRGTAVLFGKRLLAWQDWEEVNRQFGIVFDLGTSTLVGKLVNLQDGREHAVVSLVNSQIRYGTDVISRIKYVRGNTRRLKALNGILLKDLNRIVRRLLEVGGLKPEDIFLVVAAGNTTIQHFFLGLPPSGIAEAPFSPVTTDGLTLRASDAGLKIHPEALLFVMPTRSSYIGGDLISVILASGAAEQEEEIVLGMDFGTNGEIFLGNGRRLLTCSAAAGPALEGATISQGMIARQGAIETVRLNKKKGLRYGIIGNIAPKGICGSGLVDLAAVLLDQGIIDPEGLILPDGNEAPASLRKRVVQRGEVHAFEVAPAKKTHHGNPILLTQKDVRELQLAKGAVSAGVRILMKELGVELRDISRVYLAGALGNYVDPRSAMRIGLIPSVEEEIVTSLGNAASTGATMALLSRWYWDFACEIAQTVENVDLFSRLDFNEVFVEEMDFPRNAPGA